MPTPESPWYVSLVPAAFGIVGVLLGSGLATLKEWWFHRRNEKRDAKYLAVQVVGQLDRYVFACSEVATDDGLCLGQPDQDGYRRPQTDLPVFEPAKLEVEWRSISTDLMYEILDLPYKAEVARHIIAGAHENADPPDFEDYFEERQLQFSSLGLLAASIASRLRVEAGLPERTIAHWDPVGWMSDCKSKIEASRAERARACERERRGESDA